MQAASVQMLWNRHKRFVMLAATLSYVSKWSLLRATIRGMQTCYVIQKCGSISVSTNCRNLRGRAAAQQSQLHLEKHLENECILQLSDVLHAVNVAA